MNLKDSAPSLVSTRGSVLEQSPSSHRPKRACELAHEVEKCSALGSAFCTSLQYQKVFSVMVVIFCFVMVVIRLAPVSGAETLY